MAISACKPTFSITEHIDELGILGEEQAGFRHDYSKMVHVFVLKLFID